MTRFKLPLLSLAVALLFAGCSTSQNPADGGDTQASVTGDRIEAFVGPGGSVAVGDPAAQFDKAFPRPEGSTTPESPPLEGVEFVGWQNDREMASAAIQDGKIAALYHGKAKAEPDWIAEARSRFGKAELDVSNDLGAVANWKRGDKELVIMLQQGQGGGLTVRVAGTSEMLKRLQLNAGELASNLEAQARAISGSPAGQPGHSPDDGHGH